MDVPEQMTVAIVGLGYVGLPLAQRFGERYPTLGFDRDNKRLEELRDGFDRTGAVDKDALRQSRVELTDDPARLGEADIIIVTVPTPVDAQHQPDLTAIKAATATVGRHMKQGAIVVYESTVYPGLTEEVCAPLLEAASGLQWKADFFIGYSPERVNPGDRERTVETIIKVVAGDTAETLERLAVVYGSVIPAGIHCAESIRVAEAAKVIENTQRDLNIALMNELSVLFHKLGLDTQAVLRAAGTKWNFLPFEPGLVGGHCIGVDPYYLTHKAREVGHQPDIILAGRRINDEMGRYVAQEAIALTGGSGRVLVFGWTFKENVADARNTRVAELVAALRQAGIETDVHDPCADPEEVKAAYGEALLAALPEEACYDAVVLAVRHDVYQTTMTLPKLRTFCRGNAPALLDVKGMFPREAAEAAGFRYWRL